MTKSPYSEGRFGPAEKQDWFKGLVKASKLLDKFHGWNSSSNPAKILIISNVHMAGEEHEADIYAEVLRNLGVKDNDIKIIREAQETIGQVEKAKEIARACNLELIVISTFLHYFRVRWLFRGFGAKHYVALGIPRSREIATDIVLTVLFPIIDLLGKRKWLQRKIIERRSSGRF